MGNHKKMNLFSLINFLNNSIECAHKPRLIKAKTGLPGRFYPSSDEMNGGNYFLNPGNKEVRDPSDIWNANSSTVDTNKISSVNEEMSEVNSDYDENDFEIINNE